jgi:hypothetical protein
MKPRLALPALPAACLAGPALAQPAAEACAGGAARVGANANLAHMQAFLRTFSDRRCLADTEYAEAGNERLFDAIERQPALFFSALFALSAAETAAVRAQIDEPVSDCVNLGRGVAAVRVLTA